MSRLNLSQKKTSQDEAGYFGPEQGPFMCAHCEYFKGPRSCAKVSGVIDPNGCCNLYESVEEEEDFEEAE